ncbi:hypothetical protein ACRTDL_20430 [Shewanella algae]|uniref:hypothetical protein n=1 Tax=Shewanella algae TaxID=38313 RepID=UPI003D7EBC14
MFNLFKNKCNKCGMDTSLCICLSVEVEEFKKEIKDNYSNLAGSNASKSGLANHVWTKLYNTSRHLEKTLESEAKAWEEKRLSVITVSKNITAKYESIIESNNKEISEQKALIKKLQSLLEKPQKETGKKEQKSSLECPGCGSKTGCYCS